MAQYPAPGTPPPGGSYPQSTPAGPLKIEASLLARAKQQDPQAIATMFRQFIPDNESLCAVEYLGVEGIWGLGTLSFGCLTDRRLAAIRVAPFGEVLYQDGYLEYLNSGVVYQPSKLGLYILMFVMILLAIPTFGIALLFIPLAVRGYYRVNKCGLVFCVKEGVNIYLFTNRNRLLHANRLYRAVTNFRDQRLRTLKHLP